IHVVASEGLALNLGHPHFLGFVHVLDASTHEGFVYFDSASTVADLPNGFVLHGETNAVEHEPCSLLRDLQVAGNFVAANTVLAISDEPHGRKPLVQSDCGILHHRSDLDGKFALWVMASTLPCAALLAVPYAIGAASWTYNLAIWPATARQVANAVVGIREVNKRLLQALWFAHGNVPHEQNCT